jgi:uncharacterized protein (DUF1499 family)
MQLFTRIALIKNVKSLFRGLYIGLAIPLAALCLAACTGNSPATLGVSDAGLAPCPSSPNCVSSDARDNDHRVAPLQLAAPAAEAWQAAREQVAEIPRTRIVSEEPGYLHAECRSALLGFIDDLELNLRPSEGIIAVRSAARLGYSDFGVNRKRVEALRAALLSRGIAH